MSENPMAIRSKNSIEEALLALMEEQPYRKISISSVTERAGLSRQTFYLNFADKDAVLSRYLMRLFDGIMLRVSADEVDTVEGLVSTYTSIVEENSVFFRRLAENSLTGLVSRLYSEKLSALPPVLRCQRENQTDAERRYFNIFWVAAFVEAYAMWLLEDMKTDRETINRIIADIMLGNYFRPEDGRK